MVDTMRESHWMEFWKPIRLPLECHPVGVYLTYAWRTRPGWFQSQGCEDMEGLALHLYVSLSHR
jgi:hypothetical protein